MKKNSDEISIGDLVDVFLPKLWLIVIVGILLGGFLGVKTMFFEADTYTTTGKLLMNKVPTKYSEGVSNSPQSTGINANEIEAMQRLISMSEEIMKADDFIFKVKNKLAEMDSGYADVSNEQLKRMLSIETVGEETVFAIKTVSTDPKLGFYVAEIVYEMLPDDIIATFDTYAIDIKEIETPTKAKLNGKSVVKDAAIGFIGGALLTMAIIFIVFKLDVMIRSKERLEDNFDIPVIGVIPRLETMD